MRGVRQRAWMRWQAAAGAWRGWSVCPLLTAPDLIGPVPMHVTPRNAETIADKLQDDLDEGGTAIMADLDPLIGIHVAAMLNQRGLAHAVLVLPRWPYAEAVLRADGLIGALITASQVLRSDDHMRNVIFVLDVLRHDSVRRTRSDPRADNRYRLVAHDLPNLAALRRAGVRRVVKLSRA